MRIPIQKPDPIQWAMEQGVASYIIPIRDKNKPKRKMTPEQAARHRAHFRAYYHRMRNNEAWMAAKRQAWRKWAENLPEDKLERRKAYRRQWMAAWRAGA